jgi:hypothetical protein
MAKMSDGTEAFVMKVMEFAAKDQQFNPPYLDVPELKKDLDVHFLLKPLETTANQMAGKFIEIVMIEGCL